ncbi:MAG: A24 family peptidase [Candidatus Woesearchaeota archaeon]
MIEVLLFLVALFVLIVGAYTDIRTREVPDWVNFGGIVAGLGIRAAWGFAGNGWAALGFGLFGFVVFFALSIIMYYSRQWGGGDSKLLMAMGALLGLWFSKDNAGVGFLLWVLLAGAGYGIVSNIVLAVMNWKLFLKRYAELFNKVRWANFPVLFVFLLGFAFAVATDDLFFRMLVLFVALIVPVLFYLAIGVKAVENCCMYRKIHPCLLTEGDWIAKPVFYKRRYLCGPKDLGVTKKKIRELRRLGIKQVIVKDGIPFVPSFLMAFLFYLWLGSPLEWFFKVLSQTP